MAEASGFWGGGHNRHHEALVEAEKEELAALKQRLFSASSDEKAALELEMKSVGRKYRELRASTDHNLYLGQGDGGFDPDG